MLSCSSVYDDDSGDGWYYYPPHDFSTFRRKKRKRCCSCGQFIEIGAQSVSFDRYRSSRSDIEERIYGDEVSLADFFMCESCGEIYFNLSSIGYEIQLGDNMLNLLLEYQKMTSFVGLSQDTKNNKGIKH